MPLNPSALSSSMQSAFNTAYTATSDPSAAVEALCDTIAAAIVTCIEGLTITYSTGLVAPSGGGPVTGSLAACTIS